MLAFEKLYLCLFIPNCTRKIMWLPVLMSSLPISISPRLNADIQIPKTWLQVLLPFPYPHCKAPQRACSQAILNTTTDFAAKWHLRNISTYIPYWWPITTQNSGPVRIKFWQVTRPWNSDLRLVKMATNDIKVTGTWPSLQTAK